MNKIIKISLIISLICSLCACSSMNKEDKKTLENATVFKQCLLNSYEGYPIISTYLPDNFRSDIYLNYQVSFSYPLQAIATFTSEDDSFGIFYFSPMSFLDQTNLYDRSRTNDDGSHSILNYATYYHYRDAYNTSDLILSMLGYKWTSRNSYDVDQNILNNYKNNIKEKAISSYEFQKNTLDSNNTKYQALILNNYDATIDKSRGYLSDGINSFYAETTTYVSMQDIRFEADTLILLNMVYGYEIINWQVDGFSIYWAVNEEVFNENYELAQFIISNTATTKAFASASEKILSIMIPQVLEGRQEISDYGASIVKEVMDSFNSTNDRVAQNWDDYILDVDRYSTNDGSIVSVPTSAEYVYYDNSNNDIIWTTSALLEPGKQYSQIYK